MRIVTKLNFGVLGALAASAIANYVVMQQTIQPHFVQIDQSTAFANHKRVSEALEAQIAKVRSTLQDWAYWDDLKNYVLGVKVEEFSATNLETPEQVMDPLGIEYMSIRDVSGRELWGRAFDLKSKTALPQFQSEISRLPFAHPYLKKMGDLTPFAGVVATSHGLTIVGVAPIVASNHDGDAVGTIWMAVRIDDAVLQRITGVEFKFSPKTLVTAVQSGVANANDTAGPIITRSVVLDIDQKPSADLVVSTPRSVTELGKAAIFSAFLLMALGGAAVIGTLQFMTHHFVVSRVVRLKDHFANAQRDGRLMSFAGEQTNDEFNELSASFNTMAAQVNTLRDEVARQQSRVNDLNEWAAGTLHNVRNSLSPINALAWSMKSALPDTWLVNVRAAAAELSNPEGDPARREKLSLFLRTSAHELSGQAEQTKRAADDIMAASKNIEEMVSDYERFTLNEKSSEDVSALELLQEVSATALKRSTSPVAINLPKDALTIYVNRAVARQILLNFFWNAIDAVSKQDREKRIDVGLSRDSEGTISISVLDNGEGIEPANLGQLFKKGFSTRKHRLGGRGLHWCANAATSLGWAVRAESRGKGQGAKLVLCIPSTSSKTRVAA